MTLTFDLETWLGFRVTAHPLPTCTLCGKYEPDWDKGRQNMLRTCDVGETNGWAD